jgi:hypothetical protein
MGKQQRTAQWSKNQRFWKAYLNHAIKVRLGNILRTERHLQNVWQFIQGAADRRD